MANDKNFVVKNGLEVGGQLIVDAQGNIQLPDGSFSSIEGLYDVTEYTNVQNETTFELVYDVGLVQVLYNGVQLAQTDFTATDGENVVLDVAVAKAEDVITIIRWGAINESSVVVEAPTPTTVPKRTSTGAIRAAEGSASDEVVTKSQLDLKASLDSPTLTGVPTAPTANAGTNTTQIATTAYVQTAVDDIPTRLQINTRSTPVDVNILNAKIIVAARTENVEIGVI